MPGLGHHRGKFDSFQAIRPLVVQQQGRCDALEQHPYIYMRWKERFFVNVGCDCGLTIAGFYYVQLSRKDGSIKGELGLLLWMCISAGR